jgi:predicted phage baseplate assembly protein
LQSRPLGLKGVTNPLRATGSAPPEALDDARANAPRTALTLERVVSLDDFEDFAAAFAGIGKAQAIPLWSGESQVVHITVGGATGGAVTPDSQLYQHLVAAIATSSDGAHLVLVDSFQPRFFKLSMSVWIDPRYVTDDVLAAATTVIEGAFTFQTRGFGQSVSEAELLALVQGVAGVTACRVDALYAAGSVPSTTSLLTALTAQWDATQSKILPAELLLLLPGGLTLTPIGSQA